jgi:prophage regulatory protein
MFNKARRRANMIKAILRFPEVKRRTGLSRSTIYLKIAEGAFPRQVSLGPRAVGWIEAEIEEWLSGQIEQSRRAALPAAKQPPTLSQGG